MKQIVLGGAAKRKSPPPAPKKRRRKRTGRQALNYLLLMLVAAAIMIALSMTVLFHVAEVTTNGLTKYAPQALIDACGVKEGDNLLRVNERAIRKKILEQFPYVEDLKLRRRLPDKLILQITEAEILGACEKDGSYVIVGASGRILETGASTAPDGAMEVYGMYMYEPEVGRVLGKLTKEQLARLQKEREAASKAASEVAEKALKRGEAPKEEEFSVLKEKSEQEKEEEAFRTLSELVAAVKETGFQNITMVDLSDSLNTAVVYDDRVLIELGSVADLSYKLQFVEYLLENKEPVGFRGVMDASYCTTSKSVVRRVGDISAELELRRARAMGESENGDGADAKLNQDGAQIDGADPSASGNPLWAVKPKAEDAQEPGSSGEASSAASGGGAGSGPEDGAESVSSMIGPYSPDMLALKPGTKKASSSEAESGVSGSSSAASSGAAGGASR